MKPGIDRQVSSSSKLVAFVAFCRHGVKSLAQLCLILWLSRAYGCNFTSEGLKSTSCCSPRPQVGVRSWWPEYL